MPPDTAPYDALAAGLLRRPGEARRRPAVPRERHPRAAASRASGSRRSASTTSLFGGRSPINDQNRALLAALERGLRRRTASTCPSTGATATGTPTSPTRCEQMRADGVTPGRLPRDQRLLVVLGLPAVPREPRRRGRAVGDGRAAAGPAAALLQPPGLRRADGRRHAGRARRARPTTPAATRTCCSSPTRSRRR